MRFAGFCSALAVGQLVVLLSLLAGTATSSKILGFFITPSRSHFIIQDSLMRGLAAKGHEVTVVSLFPPPKENITNYRHIYVEIGEKTQLILKKINEKFLDSAEKKENYLLSLPTVLKSITNLNIDTYNSPIVKRLRRDESFDLVVLGWFLNDYQIGIAADFKCPAVIVSSLPATSILRSYVGNPSDATFTSSWLLPYHGVRMSIWQRALNVLVHATESVVTAAVTEFYMKPIYTQQFPADRYPSFSEAKKNVSLVLVTSHFSQGVLNANFPSLVEVSGMHIPEKPNELPKNIKHWLDSAENGVIYFSMGSNIRSTQISSDRVAAILRVFGRLKQRVLWKWEDENLPGQPKNVMVQSWLPQADILAHRNVSLFITHCGKGSLNEARFHGVPLLGIPVFGDQPMNLKDVVAEGWAVPLQYADLTEETFERALLEALQNPSYGQVVQKKAKLYKDRTHHPLETAVFWVEYVLRHDGAKHMQSQAVHLNWVQYHGLDVAAMFAAIAWLLWKVNLWFWVSVWTCVRRKWKRDKEAGVTKKTQ